MSIDSFSGVHTPICDGCGEELEAEFDFYDAVSAKQAAGWKSVKQEWGWDDYCPDCYQKILWED